MSAARILTVRQPWAWAIIHGGKDVENRVRNIAGGYRGPVAIHAGAARFEDDGQYREVKRAIVSEQNGWPADDAELWSADLVEPDDPRFVYGAIIGVVDLIDVHRSPMCANASAVTCSPWGILDDWHLVLANPRALDEPIPYKGALGLRKTNFFVSGDWLGEYVDPGHIACTPYGCPPPCYSALAARLVATS